MRTDIHKPSSIIPEDYSFVCFEYIKIVDLGDAMFMKSEREVKEAHMKRTGGRYSGYEHGGNCHVCGASAIYTALFYHEKTNTYIRTGQDCAEKLEMSAGNWNAFRAKVGNALEALAGKRKAIAYLELKGLSKAWEIYTTPYEELPTDPTRPRRIYTGDDVPVVDGFFTYTEEITICDIVGKLVKYGDIGANAENYLRTLLERIAKRPEVLAMRAAEKAAAAPCPIGRVVVRGTILKVEERENNFSYHGGTILKMTVKDETGFIVWTTVPNGVSAKRGDMVAFTVTLTPSETDPKFGFGKRPVAWYSAEEKRAMKMKEAL
jgi:hypothetical protein